MSGLRVAVDARALAGGPGRGIAHYLRALLRAWPAGDELRLVVPRGSGTAIAADLHRAWHERRAGADDRDTPPRAVVLEHALPGRIPYALGAALGRPRLDRAAGGCDVAWLPAPAPVAAGDAPYVLAVHDRSWEARPQDFTRYERAWHAVARPRALARGAARVVTTTAWGRDDIVAAWGLDAARVRAVRLAPVIVPSGETPAPGVAPVLFVGALEPRKGPDVLAEAIALARPRGFAAPVVVVGSGRLDGLLEVPGVRAAHERGGTTGGRGAAPADDELSALYAQARALVVPSRLEGFGIPALEALAHGTPVVTSDLPPVREVLGDAATYVPAGDAEALAAALLALPAAPGAASPARPDAAPEPDPAAPDRTGAAAAQVRPAPVDRTWTAVARETRAALAEAAG